MKILQRITIALLAVALAFLVALRVRARPEQPAIPTQGAAPSSVETPPPGAPSGPPEPSEPQAEPGAFVISAVGDCTLASAENFIYSDYGFPARLGDDYAYPFSNTVQYFNADDFTIANLECVLSDRDLTASLSSQFHFKSPAAWANILPAGGVDFVNTANNHLMKDYSSSGAEDTYAALDAIGFAYGKEGQAQIITTGSGLVLGIYCDYNGLDPEQGPALAAIEQMKEDGAQYIICMFHWGQEMYYTPRDRDVELAHACVDAGANLVYGSHSHCLQPIEEYNGAVILYSMGNWSFGGSTMPSDPDTAIVQITVERSSDGSVANTGLDVIPCSVSSREWVPKTHYNDYKPTPYAEDSEGYARVMSKLNGGYQPTQQGADYSDWWQQQQ